jgi:hypothetical protein
LYSIHDSYYLVAIIDNDYVDSSLFDIFDEIVQHSGGGGDVSRGVGGGTAEEPDTEGQDFF